MLTDREADLIVSLQASLADIDSHTVNDILQSPIVDSQTGIQLLASAILTTAFTRVPKIPSLARLSVVLFNSAQTDNSLSHLKPELMKILLNSFSLTNPVPREAPAFAFFFQAFASGLFTAHEVVNLTKKLASDHRLLQSTCWLLSYFAPEIEAADGDFAEELIDRIQKFSERRLLPQMFGSFSESIDRFRAEDWFVFNRYREFFASSPGFLFRIREDDVIALQSLGITAPLSVLVRPRPLPAFPSDALLGHPTMLQTAAFFGSVKCFRWLLWNGADLHALDRLFRTLPQMAVAGGNIEIVRLCQLYNLDFTGTTHIAIKYHRHDLFEWIFGQRGDEIDIFGHNLMHSACEWNNLYAIRRLIGVCDINAVSRREGWTPLMFAIRGCHLECVRYLLSLPDLATPSKEVFRQAISRGDVRIIEALMRAGVEIPMDSMQIAVNQRRLCMIGFLLGVSGVDPNAETTRGMTPLIQAITSDADSVVELLAGNERVDVNKSTRGHYPPLYYAIHRGNRRMFEALIGRCDLDLRARMGQGCTFLHVAAKNAEMMRALIDRGTIEVNAVDMGGETALHKAASAGCADVVSVLLSCGDIDVNRMSSSGTPLRCAISAKRRSVALLLIGFPSTDINLRAPGFSSPVIESIVQNEPECVEAMCGRNDFDFTNGKGPDWLLSFASRHGRSRIIELLLQHCGDEIQKCKSAVKKALDCAIHRGFADCTQILKDWVEARAYQPTRRKKLGLLERFQRRKLVSQSV
jgi:ankyrin repeat protein